MDHDAPTKLMKWPSLNGERFSVRDGATPYAVFHGTLAECIREVQAKPASQHHLYEIHSGAEVLSVADALALQNDQPPAEEDFGGGDIVSVEAEPSTDDDRPLE